jgi:DNA-binding NtrC family response regulator
MPRILFIEDDFDVRLMMEHVLLCENYEVEVSETMAGGAALLDGRGYDLVIADARLPDGSGIELADKAEAHGIPALIITGYAFALHNDAPEVDFSKYNMVLKPVRPAELLAAVERVLGENRLHGERC